MGGPLLASVGGETVPLWNTRNATGVATVPTLHAAPELAEVDESLAVGLYREIVMIKPNTVTTKSTL